MIALYNQFINVYVPIAQNARWGGRKGCQTSCKLCDYAGFVIRKKASYRLFQCGQ